MKLLINVKADNMIENKQFDNISKKINAPRGIYFVLKLKEGYYIIEKNIWEVDELHFFVTILVLLADLITKYVIQQNLHPYQSIPVIKDIFHITYVQNDGAAFSILKGQTSFFIAMSVIAIFAVLYFMVKSPVKHGVFKIILGMILGGTLGNLIDRIRFGYVIDFIDFRFWPVFNLADCALVIGVISLAFLLTFNPNFQSLTNRHRR